MRREGKRREGKRKRRRVEEIKGKKDEEREEKKGNIKICTWRERKER